MAIEKRLPAVYPQAFTTNGTVSGILTVNNAHLFKVKQEVVITANSLPSLELQVKRIISPDIIHVGPKTGSIEARTDISSYTVSLAAAIYASEQKRPTIPEQEIERLTYEEEPVVARRIIQVDSFGSPLRTDQTDKGSSLSVSIAQLSQDVGFTFGGEIKVSDAFQGYSQGQQVDVHNTPIEAKGGLVRLVNRKGIFMYPLDTNNYFGFSSSVTTGNGIPLFQNQMVWIPASGNLEVWLIRATNTGQVRVWEVG
jgi:hypothetical protein